MGQEPSESPNQKLASTCPEDRVWQLIINETRLHLERTSFFLLANSFLLTGFAVLRQSAELGIQFVPLAVGIALSLFHFININYGERALQLWEQLLKDRREAGCLILGEREQFFQGYWWLRKPLGRLTRNIGSLVFPPLFCLMWLGLLILEMA